MIVPTASNVSEVPSAKICSPPVATKRSDTIPLIGPKFVPVIWNGVVWNHAVEGTFVDAMVGARNVTPPTRRFEQAPFWSVTRTSATTSLGHAATVGVKPVIVNPPTPTVPDTVACEVVPPLNGTAGGAPETEKVTWARSPTVPKPVPVIVNAVGTVAGTVAGANAPGGSVGPVIVTAPAAVIAHAPPWNVAVTVAVTEATPQIEASGVSPVIWVAAPLMVPVTVTSLSVPSANGVAGAVAANLTATSELAGPKPVPVIVKTTGEEPPNDNGANAIVGAVKISAAVFDDCPPSWNRTRTVAPSVSCGQTAASGATPVIVPTPVTVPGTSNAFCVPLPNGVAPASATNRTKTSLPTGPKFEPVSENAVGTAAKNVPGVGAVAAIAVSVAAVNWTTCAPELAHEPPWNATRSEANRWAAPWTVAWGVVTVIWVPAALITPWTGALSICVPSPKIAGATGSLMNVTEQMPFAGPKPVPWIVIAVGICAGTTACARLLTVVMTGAVKVTNAGFDCRHELPYGEITRIVAATLATPHTSAVGEMSVIVWGAGKVVGPIRPGTSIVLSVPSLKRATFPAAMKRTVAIVFGGPKLRPLSTRLAGGSSAGIEFGTRLRICGARKFTKPGSVGSVQQPSGKKSWIEAPSCPSVTALTPQTVAIGDRAAIVVVLVTRPWTST